MNKKNKKWYEEEDRRGRKKVKNQDTPLSTQAARYVEWVKNTYKDKVRVTSGDRGGKNHSKGNAFDLVGITSLPKEERDRAYKKALDMGLRVGEETKGKVGVGGWTGAHTHIDGSKGPSFTRGGHSGKANRKGRTKEENEENNRFLEYLNNLKNTDSGEEIYGPPVESKQIPNRQPAGVHVKPIKKEEEDEKKIDSAARASIISKHKQEIAQSAVENPNLNEEQTNQVIKHLSSDKSIKDSTDRAAGLKPQKKSPGLADQFKEALTFFAPQLIGGALSAELSGTGDQGFIAGFEQGGKARDAFLDYKRDMRDYALKESGAGRAPKAIQQSDYVKADTKEPVTFDPNDGKYKTATGQIVDPSKLQNSITLRQENSLKRADVRIGLQTDKFAHDIRKDGQLSDRQVEQVADLDASMASMGRIDDLFKDAKTGPVIGRVQNMAQLADAAPKEYTMLQAETSNMLARYVKAISGAQVSDREREMFEKMMPNVNDAPNTFRAKFDAFKNIVEAHKDSILDSIKRNQPLRAEVLQDLEAQSSKLGLNSGTMSASEKLNSMDPEKRKRYEAWKARRK